MPTSSGLYDTSTITYDQSSLSYDGFPAPLSGMPAVGVFVAWTGTPYEVNPTGGWTEISQYVRQITIRRGRQDDLQQFPPGTASLVLDNRDRLFDPFNTAGANYANLKPRKQIKIVANWNGTEYPLYRGYVAGWPVEYADGGTDSTVTIDCFDLLGLLATETAPSDWANYYTKSLDVRRYWQLNDSASATTARDQPRTGLSPLNVPFSRTGIYPAFDKSAMADGLTGGSLFFTYASGATNQAPTYTKTNATVTLWMNFSTSTPGSPAYCDTYVNNSYISIQGTVEATQSRVVVTADNGTTRAIVQYTFPTNPIPFFYAALITINVGGTPTVQLYRNLQLLTAATSSTIGGTAYTSDGVTFGTGQFQEVATFDRLLTVDEITLLYNVQTARLNETSTARVQRVLATTDVPTAMVSLPSSPAATVSEFTSGDGVMPQLQLVANSENAPLYVDDAGVLVLKQRDYYATDTRSNTSQVTFTDTGTGVEYDAGVVRLDFNADQVRNDVNVTFTGGGVINERDDTSIGAYGAAEWSLPTLIDTADNSDTLAQRLVTIYKNPKMTLEPFMSKGQQDPTYNWPRLLGLELLDRVTFKRTPATGSAIVKDLLVQSIEHRITPGEWQTVVNGSARYTNWFILGVSLLGSDDLLLN